MHQIDPKFQAWFDARKIAQRTGGGIPTQNVNPTLKAGPKNSNGKSNNVNTVKTGAKKPKSSKSVSRPKGKYRANNNF